MAEHTHGGGSNPTPATTPAMGRSKSASPSMVQSADTVFNAAYERVASSIDCSTFLTKPRSFTSSVITMALHPCYRKEGDEVKTITIGCRDQAEGIKLMPKFTQEKIENSCPSGGAEMRPGETEFMIEISLNESALKREDLFALLWNLGNPEATSVEGTNYTRRAIAAQRDSLPVFVIVIRPITRDGQPANGIMEFYRVQLMTESPDITLQSKGSNKVTLKFNCLYDDNQGSIGSVLTLA